jgi:predicted phage-related endonuclease
LPPALPLFATLVDALHLLQARQGGLQSIEEAKEEVEAINNQIKQALGENGQGRTNQYQITWKSQTRSTADTDRMKEDGIFEKYKKTSSFRVLRTSQIKEGK